jgi:hypothetical protein
MFGEPSREKLIYVSGAITPTKENPHIKTNIRLLHLASIRLFTAGFSVYCPAVAWFHDPGMYGEAWQAIMEMDFVILKRCDGIYMVHNWKDSRGAVLEHDYACGLKLPVVHELDPLNFEESPI